MRTTTQTILSLLILCCSVFVLHAQNNAVIMTINGKPVTKQEFEYTYFKNSNLDKSEQQIGVSQYAEMFANYKLKVEAAKAAGIDTTADFRKEYAMYRDIQLSAYLIDTLFIDSVARSLYDQLAQNMGGKEMLRARHIFIKTPQRENEAFMAAAKVKADSVYALLKGGHDFAALAKAVSEDTHSAVKGGELPWFGPNATLKEFEDAAYALPLNEIGNPILSPAGYHIIQVLERKPLEPFAEKKAEILTYLKRRGIEEHAANRTVERLVAESGGKLTRQDVMAQTEQRAVEHDPKLKFLLQEYYDGLLLIAISERDVWKAAEADKKGLAAYFKKNKNNYAWESPRFKGFVIHLRKQEQEKVVKKWLKKNAKGDWAKAFEDYFNKDSLMVRTEYGVYRQGDNPYVDQHAFSGKSAVNMELLPYTTLLGKKEKQPKEWEDVKAAVVADYQKAKEEEWLKVLRQKYPVTINKELLSTVVERP